MINDRYKHDLFYTGKVSQSPFVRFQEYDSSAASVVHLQLWLKHLSSKVSKSRKKEIEQAWIETLPSLRKVKELWVLHRVDQEFFEAICRLPNLTRLRVGASDVQDISSIAKLKKLARLDLKGFTKLEDIFPITELTKLRLLSIEKCFQVKNYDVIGTMTQLHGLTLGGDDFAPKKLRLKSLIPFETLVNLRHLDIGCTSVIDKSFLSILKLKRLERLDLNSNMSEALREKIKSEHPRLKAGFFVDFDFQTKKFYPKKDWGFDIDLKNSLKK